MGHFGFGWHLRDMTDIAVPEAQGAESIVRLAAVGDEAAFAGLIAAHDGGMTRVAFVVTGDWDSAREAARSAWTIAWTRLPTLRDPDRIRPWLVAIAANEARQLARRERRRHLMDISTYPEPSGDDPADQIDLLDLGRALRDLKPDDRVLIGMRYVAGFDSGPAADDLTWSPDARSILYVREGSMLTIAADFHGPSSEIGRGRAICMSWQRLEP